MRWENVFPLKELRGHGVFDNNGRLLNPAVGAAIFGGSAFRGTFAVFANRRAGFRAPRGATGDRKGAVAGMSGSQGSRDANGKNKVQIFIFHFRKLSKSP